MWFESTLLLINKNCKVEKIMVQDKISFDTNEKIHIESTTKVHFNKKIDFPGMGIIPIKIEADLKNISDSKKGAVISMLQKLL